jgi:hypothetical protein
MHSRPIDHRPLEFPSLLDLEAGAWEWPAPPFAWRYRRSTWQSEVAQPCRIEGLTGRSIDGEMSDFNGAARTLRFRPDVDTPWVAIAFTRVRRLTLTAPLHASPAESGTPLDHMPAAAQERDYQLQVAGSTGPLIGRTAGHVENPEGMFLFEPVDDEAALLRVFVPRGAYIGSAFGASAEEVAASRWIADPQSLLAAIARQRSGPVMLIGHALLALGLLTQRQLDRELARAPGEVPLGERLIAAGIISRADLRTALAHKMGYPLVDLQRFPIDHEAVRKLPQHVAQGYRAMPLMIDNDRLIVAVDKPSREVRLRELHAVSRLRPVPVLAPRVQILLALERLSKNVWMQHVPERMGYFDSTL